MLNVVRCAYPPINANNGDNSVRMPDTSVHELPQHKIMQGIKSVICFPFRSGGFEGPLAQPFSFPADAALCTPKDKRLQGGLRRSHNLCRFYGVVKGACRPLPLTPTKSRGILQSPQKFAVTVEISECMSTILFLKRTHKPIHSRQKSTPRLCKTPPTCAYEDLRII